MMSKFVPGACQFRPDRVKIQKDGDTKKAKNTES